MRLQTRLVATFILLLLGVVVIVGIVVVGSSRSVLQAPIDEELMLVQSGITDKLLKSEDLLERFAVTDDPNLPPVKSAQAIVIVDIGERVVSAQSSGFTDDPDPLPAIEYFADLVAKGGIATIPSEDGTLNYRAFGWVNDEGEIGVLAVPIGEVDAAVNGIVRTFLLTAGVVALLGGISTCWSVRRELRPVDRMVDTATAIAGGDLTQRVHDVDSSTELGRLGTARVRLPCNQYGRLSPHVKVFP